MLKKQALLIIERPPLVLICTVTVQRATPLCMRLVLQNYYLPPSFSAVRSGNVLALLHCMKIGIEVMYLQKTLSLNIFIHLKSSRRLVFVLHIPTASERSIDRIDLSPSLAAGSSSGLP